MKRKVLALLLALTLLFSMSTTSIAAFAATDPAISIEKKDAHAGDEVSIVVSIANNPGIWGMDLRISYDKTVMTLISVDNGNFYQSSEWTKGNLNADVYILSYEANDLANITTVSGTLAILNFKIKDDAALGTYNINASYNAGDIINITFDDIDFAISNGSITLTCPHTHTENRIEQPATCKDIGYTEGVFCTDCSTYVSGHKEIPISSVHSYGAWKKVNDTTHKHICGVCGKEETANHNWNIGVVTTQPTHLAEGVKTYTCSDCGATKTESVSKLTTHTYGDWEKHNETQHKRSCACGDVQYENHAWDSGKVTTQPTCKDKGVKTYTCSVCGETKTEEVAVTNDHSYGDWVRVNDNTHKHTCGVCGKEETANHNWNSGVVTTQPTHLAEGVKTYTCSDCGATKTEPVPKLTTHTYGDWEKHNETQHKRSCACGDIQYENHTWDSGKITTQPTCKDKGVKTYTCSICGETKTEDIPITNDHSYGNWVKVNETTHKHTCGICGKEETASHNWNSGVVTTQPTHLTEGVKTYTCSDCGATKTESVSKITTHTYGDWTKYNETQHKRSCACGDIQYENHTWDAGKITTQPTCKDKGIKTYTCSVCGETKTEEVPVTNDHSYGDWVKVNDNTHKHICAVCGKEETANHNWNSGVVTTQPTHLAEGVKTYTCSDCGATKTESVSKLTTHTYGGWEKHNETQHKRSCACGNIQYENHSWDSGKITTQPTCKDKGVKTYTCSICGETKTEEVPVTSDHSYGAWEKVNDTTHKHTCGVCGKEETANHNWNSGVVTTQPTHLVEGVKTYTCSDCGATKTESVSKITTHTYGDWEKYNESQHQRSCACGDVQYENHAWNAGAITTQPTCKDKGVKTYTCSVCGETRTEEVSVTSDHSYSAWEKVNDTTHKHICGVCGKEETESHKWNSGVVTIQPTEDNTGIRTYTCTTCGATKEEVIPKLDHHHEYSIEWYNDASNHWVECSCGDKDKIAAHIWNAGTKTKEATCLEDGIMTYTCTICGYTKTETVKGEHSVGEWVIVREATCSVDGLKERKCLVCGEVIESEDIKATGHTIAEWVIVNEPTCTATGLKQQKCSVCGEVLDEEIILATGHHFGDWTVENGALKRTCACGEIETKNIDKKAEELVPSDDGVKVDIGDSSSLPAGTSVKTDNLMDDLSDTEKDEITNAVKVIVSNDNGIELVSIYDISLEFEGAKIQPDGTVKVELPIPEESSQKFDSYQVVYIDDNGVAHEMPTEIKDGKIIFTTDHFSKYAVVGIINAETPPEPSIIPWLIVGSVVVCATVVFVVILINKKRKKSQQNA